MTEEAGLEKMWPISDTMCHVSTVFWGMPHATVLVTFREVNGFNQGIGCQLRLGMAREGQHLAEAARGPTIVFGVFGKGRMRGLGVGANFQALPLINQLLRGGA